jgi:Uma2 family endonuclease
MTVKPPPHLYTFDDFLAFIALPENEDRLFEFIDGEIIEVSPGRTRNSGFGHLFAVKVHNFSEQHNLPCFTSGGDGAYSVQGHTVAPDFAYKRTPLSDEYPDPVPPLWVIEVISPTDRGVDIRKKRRVYREAGILLWEMYPLTESIDVYTPGKPQQEFGVDDVLDVGDILPGFTLALRDIFRRSE